MYMYIDWSLCKSYTVLPQDQGVYLGLCFDNSSDSFAEE